MISDRGESTSTRVEAAAISSWRLETFGGRRLTWSMLETAMNNASAKLIATPRRSLPTSRRCLPSCIGSAPARVGSPTFFRPTGPGAANFRPGLRWGQAAVESDPWAAIWAIRHAWQWHSGLVSIVCSQRGVRSSLPGLPGAGIGEGPVLVSFERYLRAIADGQSQGVGNAEGAHDARSLADDARLQAGADEPQLGAREDDRVLDLGALEDDVGADGRVRADVGVAHERAGTDDRGTADQAGLDARGR